MTKFRSRVSLLDSTNNDDDVLLVYLSSVARSVTSMLESSTNKTRDTVSTIVSGEP